MYLGRGRCLVLVEEIVSLLGNCIVAPFFCDEHLEVLLHIAFSNTY